MSRRTAIPVYVALALSTACSWFRPRPPEYDAIELASGLVVRDLVVPESGTAVKAGDTVAVHYELRLEDLTLVETSVESGQPLRFQVGARAVPAGLDEGVLGMRLFGRRRLTVPPDLGFGGAGKPPLVPPDATLIFDVELMELVSGP